MNLKNMFLLCRLDKERTKEKTIVTNDAIRPRLIVLNERISNSVVKLLCSRSIFKMIQKHGIPIEKLRKKGN